MNRTILEFVGENGRGAVKDWIAKMRPGIKEGVEAELDSKLTYLRFETSPQRPDCAAVTGSDSEGLFKLRFKFARVQYRPIFFYGPGQGEATLLAGAIEKDGELIPPSIRKLSQNRKKQVEQDRRYVRGYFG